MNEKMSKVAYNIGLFIISYFPQEFLFEVVPGRITSRDIALQVMVECAKYAYEQTEPTHSLRYYLDKNDITDDSQRMVIQRTFDNIRKYKGTQNKAFNTMGLQIEGLVPPKLSSVADKLSGHNLTAFQFWEICDVHENRLVKAILDKRVGKKNFSTTDMQIYADEYEAIVEHYIHDWEYEREDPLFDFLALFTLESKYSFDFYYSIAMVMTINNITNLDDIKWRIGFLSAPFCRHVHWADKYPGIFPSFLLMENRMLVARRKYVQDIVTMDKQSFSRLRDQFINSSIIIATVISMMCLENLSLRDWFIQNTNKNDWLSVFEEYYLFDGYIPNKKWDKKRLRIIKDIYNSMSFDYKNPDFRS